MNAALLRTLSTVLFIFSSQLFLLTICSYTETSWITYEVRDKRWEVQIHRGWVYLSNRAEAEAVLRHLEIIGFKLDMIASVKSEVSRDAATSLEREVRKLERQENAIHSAQNLRYGLPLLPIAGIMAALPFLRLISAARVRLRKRNNCCIRCGYDLRASPKYCPECGEGRRLRPRAEGP